jgi:CRISPR-associated endonuclease/helicase Cas3
VDLPWVPAAVIRRKDLVELFDTTPDLAGNDIDISRFIRDTEDLDVLVLWRSHVPANEATLTAPPQRDELCPVPVGEFREFAERLSGAASGDGRHLASRWDFLEGKWIPCRANDIFAGQVYLLDLGAGGYTANEGWVGHLRGVAVTPLPAPAMEAADHHGADALTTSTAWATVAAHTETVVATLQAMLAALPDTPREALAYGARWHDRGKTHAIFQGALPCDDAHPPGAWAKAPAVQRYQNPHFRHELASALAALQASPDLIPSHLRDFVAYLVAAHHGKVRLSIRSFPGERRPADDRAFARGVWHGDLLPETDLGGGVIAPVVPLDLAPAQLGRTADNTPSWSERMLILRDAPHVGPFRLALLEAILRAADQRASVIVSGDDHA